MHRECTLVQLGPMPSIETPTAHSRLSSDFLGVTVVLTARVEMGAPVTGRGLTGGASAPGAMEQRPEHSSG